MYHVYFYINVTFIKQFSLRLREKVSVKAKKHEHFLSDSLQFFIIFSEMVFKYMTMFNS